MQARQQVERALREVATEDRAVNEKRYLKSELIHIGARVPDIRRVMRGVLKTQPRDRPSRLELERELWDSAIHELRFAAVLVLANAAKKTLQAEDATLIEERVRAGKTWALVDPLATDVMGTLVPRFELGATLDRWSTDEDFWVRRAAMLSLLRPLRSGGGDWARFTRYADAMLEEKEFFIRKAIGWVLRDVGRKRPELTDEFIRTRTHRASGVTMREVVKALPEARKEALMKAYREKRGRASVA